jgi:hypothetical protein
MRVEATEPEVTAAPHSTVGLDCVVCDAVTERGEMSVERRYSVEASLQLRCSELVMDISRGAGC